MKNVIVIGGGITGLCCAYYLSKAGHSVTVLDRGDMSSGVSYLNAGYITPSHFVPLAAPGVVSQGLKWMLNASSPFYVQPRWDTDFFRWGMLFRRSSTAAHVRQSIPVLKELNLRSRTLYEQMRDDWELPFHYERKGLLMVYRSSKGEEEERTMAELARQEGLQVELLEGSSLQELQPAFSSEVLGAVHYHSDAHMTPTVFMDSLKKVLSARGVVFERGQQIKGFLTENKRIRFVESKDALFEADEVVLSAGSWTGELASVLDIRLPLQGGKGYSMEVHRPTGITLPAILSEAKVAVTPMSGFTRFAGTMEFSGNNTIIRKKRVQAIVGAVENYYTDVKLTPAEQDRAVAGLRPITPDGLPYLGRTRAYSNLTIATGNAMMGWSLGPISGLLVAQVINGELPELSLAPFSPDRFL